MEPVDLNAPVDSHSETSPFPAGPFSSRYQTFGGTLTAVALGLIIIVGIQIIVSRVFSGARTMSDSLTTFATSMVAILVAIYVCDLLIAGPDVMLLREAECTTIVTFIKDISLMCFSYYFGSKTSKEPTT
jgi:cbb3-type cytochrome oxidase subunit 1